VVDIIYAIVGTLLILASLAGLVLPFIPGGVPVAWLGLLIYAAGTSFERISVPMIIIFSIVMVLTILFDFFAPLIGGAKYKPGKWGVLGAAFGSLSGIFLFGAWGIIIGPFLGSVLGEYVSGKEPGQAFKIGIGTMLVLLVGMVIKVIIVMVMLGFMIASWF